MQPSAQPFRASLAGKRLFLLLAVAVILADQWTKWWVETHLAGRPPMRVIPDLLNFIHVRNTGVAFGLLPSGGDLAGTVALSLLGLAGFSLLGYYFLRTPVENRLLLASLGLVLGGAVGNLADRIGTGAVTDFIDLYIGRYHWYTFNVADSAITVGIVLMTVELVLKPRDDPRGKGAGAGPAAGAPPRA